MDKEGKFFIVNEDSSDTAPRQIYFNLDEAVEDGADYIDVFGENGHPICFYVLNEGEYTKHTV